MALQGLVGKRPQWCYVVEVVAQHASEARGWDLRRRRGAPTALSQRVATACWMSTRLGTAPQSRKCEGSLVQVRHRCSRLAIQHEPRHSLHSLHTPQRSCRCLPAPGRCSFSSGATG